jgi:thiamine transport system ATP-binding protein
MIHVDNVNFTYEDMLMLFDLKVGHGELLAVIGPSGSGKSTLLNLIAGFEQPRSGRIVINGDDVTAQPPEDRPVTMIFQDHNSFAHLDLWTNVALGISPRLKLDAAEKTMVDEALGRVGLAHMRHRKPGEVSGGERQRIAIARALVRNRPVLLLDEPFTALGPGLRREMLDLILDIRREKDLTILLVTHDPGDARYAASHVAYLEAGRVIAKRPVKEFFSSKDIPGLASYIGSDAG